MKARNKKTGEIVSNFNISKEWGTASYIDSTNTLRFSTPTDGEWEIIDESESIDWDAFRREAAKDFLTGILAHAGVSIAENDAMRLTRLALTYADELIKQLKGQ